MTPEIKTMFKPRPDGSFGLERVLKNKPEPEKLPTGIYRIRIFKGKTLLVADGRNRFSVPRDLIGDIQERHDIIMAGFDDDPRGTGAILDGCPGSGKTVLSEMLANTAMEDYDIPVIVVDVDHDQTVLTEVVDTIGSCMLLFDEFEKVYGEGIENDKAARRSVIHTVDTTDGSTRQVDRGNQSLYFPNFNTTYGSARESDEIGDNYALDYKNAGGNLLSFFSSSSFNKVLRVIAVNSHNALAPALKNRPGRFKYRITHTELDIQTIYKRAYALLKDPALFYTVLLFGIKGSPKFTFDTLNVTLNAIKHCTTVDQVCNILFILNTGNKPRENTTPQRFISPEYVLVLPESESLTGLITVDVLSQDKGSAKFKTYPVDFIRTLIDPDPTTDEVKLQLPTWDVLENTFDLVFDEEVMETTNNAE